MPPRKQPPDLQKRLALNIECFLCLQRAEELRKEGRESEARKEDAKAEEWMRKLLVYEGKLPRRTRRPPKKRGRKGIPR